MLSSVIPRGVRHIERYRGLISWSLLVGAFMLNYAHRLSLATIGSEIMADLGLGASALGLLSAIYFYAYGGATIPAGFLVDRYGARTPAALALLIAGAGGLLLALSSGLTLALIGRFCLASGLALILPAIIKIQRDWFPLQRFGTLTGITASAGNLSALLAISAMVLVVNVTGWRMAVIGLSLLTAALGMLIWLVVREPSASQVNVKGLGSDSNAPTRQIKKQLATVLGDWRIWPPLLAALGNYGGFIALVGVWGVPYLNVTYGMDLFAAGTYVQLLLVGMIIGSPLLGWISDRIQNRRIPYTLATIPILASWFWLTLGIPPIDVVPILFFCTGVGVSASTLGITLTGELFPPQQVSFATSLVNAGGTFGGALSQPAMGIILQQYGLTIPGFQAAFVVGLGGAVLCFVMTLLFARPPKVHTVVQPRGV